MMDEKITAYEDAKQAIRQRKIEERLQGDRILDDEFDDMIRPRRKIDLLDISKLGAGVLIGGGLGLMAGVATIAVAASAAEIVIGGVITKVAGVVGGATGLGWGLHAIDKKKNKESVPKGDGIEITPIRG